MQTTLLQAQRARLSQCSLPVRISEAPALRLARPQRAALLRASISAKAAAQTGDSPSFNSVDYESLMESQIEDCPHGACEGVMRQADTVLTAKTTERLEDLIPRLNKVSGLPVVDANSRVIGVISRKDIIRVRRADGSLRDLVSDHMTSPAMTVGPKTSVRQAAKLMLQHKIRRLPVVDAQGKAIGLLSRSDIFKPLFKGEYEAFMEREREAMATGSGVLATWEAKYLFDGDCPMCRSLKGVLERQDNRRGLIAFVDISDMYYDPMQNMGIEYEDAMTTIHAIQPDGSVLMGTDALRLLFNTVGLGWAVDIMEVPLLNKIVDWLYDFLSANRTALSGTPLFQALDGIIAAKRIDMSKQGVETCGDVDEECTIEW